MYSPQIQWVLRALSVMVEKQGGLVEAQRHPFDSLEVASLLADGGHDPSHFIAVVHSLEAEGLIEIVGRPGQSGADRTWFVLSDRGYAIGNPDVHAGALRSSMGSTLKRAGIFTLGLLGITGGPLAFASLLGPAVEWNGTVYWLLSFWYEKVTYPMQCALEPVLARVGLGHLYPSTVESLVEYVTLGLLVGAASWNATRVQREFVYAADTTNRIPFAKRVLGVLIYYTVHVVLWPIFLLWELLYTVLIAYLYRYRRHELDPSQLVTLSPKSLVARAVTFGLPTLVFFCLLVMSWVTR